MYMPIDLMKDCMHLQASSPRRYYRRWSPLRALCVLCNVGKTAVFITTNNGFCCSAEFLWNDFSMQTPALSYRVLLPERNGLFVSVRMKTPTVLLLQTAIKERRCNKSSIDWADRRKGQQKLRSDPSHSLYTELQLMLWQKSLDACNAAINIHFRLCVKTLSQWP